MRTREEIIKKINELHRQLELLETPIPKPVEPYEMQFENLRNTVVDFVKFLWSTDDSPLRNNISEGDFERWIREQAIMAVYGRDIWEKIRELQK